MVFKKLKLLSPERQFIAYTHDKIQCFKSDQYFEFSRHLSRFLWSSNQYLNFFKQKFRLMLFKNNCHFFKNKRIFFHLKIFQKHSNLQGKKILLSDFTTTKCYELKIRFLMTIRYGNHRKSKQRTRGPFLMIFSHLSRQVTLEVFYSLIDTLYVLILRI